MTLEEIEKKRKQLIFRSWHRGTREMDLIMGTFADAHLSAFNGDALAQYEEILNYSDPDLYNWYSGKETVPANLANPVLDALLAHKYSRG